MPEGNLSFVRLVIRSVRLNVRSLSQFPDIEAGTNFESCRPASLRDVRYDEACNRLAVEAVKRGCTDNVTVMIIDIQKPQSQ